MNFSERSQDKELYSQEIICTCNRTHKIWSRNQKQNKQNTKHWSYLTYKLIVTSKKQTSKNQQPTNQQTNNKNSTQISRFQSIKIDNWNETISAEHVPVGRNDHSVGEKHRVLEKSDQLYGQVQHPQQATPCNVHRLCSAGHGREYQDCY